MYRKSLLFVKDAEGADTPCIKDALLEAAAAALPKTYVARTVLAPAILSGDTKFAKDLLSPLASYWG